MSGALDKLSERFESAGRRDVPEVGSFMEFLTEHARVKTGGGSYVPYSLKGRECLVPVIETFDLVLGSHTGKPLADATIDICGGAQFGKTILALNFGAYLTGCRFFNWGYYLPDDDLVEGIVDTKLRPDVIEQIEWLGELMQVGKMEDKRGRSVNRKGAFQVSDGKRKAFGMIRGMGKIPTSFSMDCAMEDEKDDIPAKRSKYLTGRMTASDLRLRSSIGTQRLHGAGQQKQWEDGSQGIFEFETDLGMLNLEESWPDCCRMAVTGEPKTSDPKLTLAGDFRDDAGDSWDYEPGGCYYFAHPETGYVVDRSKPVLRHLRPERIKQRKWSFRVSQFCIAALDPGQFVSRWQAAVKDSDMMVVFCCDVKALPANTEQAITPEILQRARSSQTPFDLTLGGEGGRRLYGGLDTGNRCWFMAREVESEAVKRVRWAEQIPLANMVDRAELLFHRLGLACLFVDARPAVSEARTLCYKLNGLQDIDWGSYARFTEKDWIRFPGGLTWNGDRQRWEGLRCAVVEFTRKEGAGLLHKLGREDTATGPRFFPIIQANRFETIDRAVKEFLTPEENVVRVVGGEVLDLPVMRLPQKLPGCPPILETLESHLLTGSKREEGKDGEPKDYVDGCENHLLLADGYSALAEQVGGNALVAAPAEVEPVDLPRAKRTGRAWV
jgi:hypothetical protein